MSNRSNQAFLKDILEACDRARSYTDNMSYEHSLADTRTQDAVIRNIEIIGEAVKQLPESLREANGTSLSCF